MMKFSDLDWPALFFLRTLEICVPLPKANAIRVECYLEPGNSNLKVRQNEKQKPNTGRPCSLTQAVETGSFRVPGGSEEKAGQVAQAVSCAHHLQPDPIEARPCPQRRKQRGLLKGSVADPDCLDPGGVDLGVDVR